MDSTSESMDSSPEATDEEEEEQNAGGSVGEEVNLGELLATDEIKEEEVELDVVFIPADDTPDPIAADAIPVDGSSSDSADEAVRGDGLRHGHRKVNKSGSSTETADEGEGVVGVSKKRKGKAVSPVPRKKSRIQPKFNRFVIPRFVPGMMVLRNKKHLCLKCGNQFDSTLLFATHTKKFHVAAVQRYPYECHYCPRMFRRKLTWQRHLLIHSKLEPLRCPICLAEYYSALGMASHLISHQSKALLKKPAVVPNLENSIYSKKVTPLDNVCFDCGATEVSEDNLVIHLKTHKGLLQCKACYEMVPSVTEFLEHVQDVHNNEAELTYYCCPAQHCARSFLSASDMRKHSQTCASPEQDKTLMDCGICGLTYHELDHFVTHMRLHGTLSREILGPSQCKVCPVLVKNSSAHAGHMVTRHGYRDQLESLANAYGKLDIVPPDDSSDEG